MSLLTTCPHCGTVFSMVPEQLEASEGHVRCGHCMEVFDAQSQLLSADELVEPSRPIENLDTGVDESSHAALSFVQQAQKQAFWSKKNVRFGMLFVILLFLVSLTLQMIRNERERVLIWMPSLQPAIQKLCTVWVCKTQANRQIDAWAIESSNFEKITTASNTLAFRLTAQLKNTSKNTLLLPSMELSLVDNSDTLLVRHVIDLIDPIDNAIPAHHLQVVNGGEERSFQFLITLRTNTGITPNNMTGYHLALFYP